MFFRKEPPLTEKTKKVVKFIPITKRYTTQNIKNFENTYQSLNNEVNEFFAYNEKNHFKSPKKTTKTKGINILVRELQQALLINEAKGLTKY